MLANPKQGCTRVNPHKFTANYLVEFKSRQAYHN